MKQRDILLLAISVFVLIVSWIGFNIYHNLAVTTISEPIEKNINPISPNFDTKAIEAIKMKARVDPLFEAEINQPSSSSPSSELETATNEEIAPINPGAEEVITP